MIEHLSVGDAVGLAFRVCRRDLKVLLGILMLPTVIYTIGKLGMLWGSREYMLFMSKGTPTLADFQTIIFPCLVLLICIVVSYSALFWLMCKELAYTRLIVFELEDYGEALKFVSKQKWKLIGFMICTCVVFVAWFSIIGIVVGVTTVLVKILGLSKLMMAVVAIPLVLVFVFSVFAFFVPCVLYCLIMAMEGQGFFDTLKRAVRLSIRNFGKLVGFGFLSYISMTTVGFALQAPYQLFYLFHYINSIARGAENYTYSPILTVPLYLQMLASVWQSIIFMYLYTVVFLSAGYVYYSIRMKEDGIDLLQAIENKSPEEQLD